MQDMRKWPAAIEERVPLANPAEFCDWLVNGIRQFDENFSKKGVGVEEAFPGYIFSIVQEIPPQFSNLYVGVNPQAQQVIRDGIHLALTDPPHLQKMVQSPIALFSVVRIGLDVDRDRTVSGAAAILPLLRKEIENTGCHDGDGTPYRAYTHLALELFHEAGQEVPVRAALVSEHRAQLKKPMGPVIGSLLKRFVEEAKPA